MSTTRTRKSRVNPAQRKQYAGWRPFYTKYFFPAYIAFRKMSFFAKRKNPFWVAYERVQDETVKQLWDNTPPEDQEAAGISMKETIASRARSVANLYVTVALMAGAKVGLFAVLLPVGISIKSAAMVLATEPLLISLACDVWGLRCLRKELRPNHKGDERIIKLKQGAFGNYNEQGRRSGHQRFTLWRSRVWITIGSAVFLYSLYKACLAIAAYAATL